ncbi:MAG TPA: hypothetical protein GXX54_04295 [Clostridiales bacterium]|nr:hypothetical protein [Clostridiales bacterium]
MKLCKLPGFLFFTIFLGHILLFTAIAEKISLLATDLRKWESIETSLKNTKSNGTVAYAGGVFKFGNTNGLWPGMEYRFPDKITFNLEKDRIAYDFTPGMNTNIILYFQDKNGGNQFVYLNPGIAGVVLDNYNSEILPSQNPYKGEMALGQLNTGDYNGNTFPGAPVSSFADEYGNIFLTGVRIDIIGNNKKTVDFKTLAVITPDKTTAKTTRPTQTSETTTSKKKANSTNSKPSGTVETSVTGKTGEGTTGKSASETPVSQKGSTNLVSKPSYEMGNGAEHEITSVTQNSTMENAPSGIGTENSNTATIPAGKEKFDRVYFNKSKLAIPVICGILLIITLAYFRKYPQKNKDNME